MKLSRTTIRKLTGGSIHESLHGINICGEDISGMCIKPMLVGGSVTRTKCNGTIFYSLSNTAFNEVEAPHSDIWNADRCVFNSCAFPAALLRGLVSGCKFTDCEMPNVRFMFRGDSADGMRPNKFRRSNLYKFDSPGVNLAGTVFDDCVLSAARLSRASLEGVVLKGCVISDCNVAGSRIPRELMRRFARETPLKLVNAVRRAMASERFHRICESLETTVRRNEAFNIQWNYVLGNRECEKVCLWKDSAVFHWRGAYAATAVGGVVRLYDWSPRRPVSAVLRDICYDYWMWSPEIGRMKISGLRSSERRAVRRVFEQICGLSAHGPRCW